MIRKRRKEDLDKIMQIWLNTNIKAHQFIKEPYWRDNYAPVLSVIIIKALPEAPA